MPDWLSSWAWWLAPLAGVQFLPIWTLCKIDPSKILIGLGTFSYCWLQNNPGLGQVCPIYDLHGTSWILTQHSMTSDFTVDILKKILSWLKIVSPLHINEVSLSEPTSSIQTYFKWHGDSSTVAYSKHANMLISFGFLKIQLEQS